MKKLLDFFSFVLAILFTACSSAPHVETGASVYNPYPEAEAPALMAIEDVSPSELVERGSSIVLGKLKKELDPEIVKESSEWFDALLEKNPDAELSETIRYRYIFSVEETLSGEALPDEIIIKNLWKKELNNDDRFILILNHTEEYYTFAHPTQAIFYVSEEDRVYPAGRMSGSIQYTGMTVGMFKEAVNS